MRWPRCSASVSRQRVPPCEIVIADDGSGAATRRSSKASHARRSCPCAPCRSRTQGFRVARLRNLAIAATNGRLHRVRRRRHAAAPRIRRRSRALRARAAVSRRACAVLADAALTRAPDRRTRRFRRAVDARARRAAPRLSSALSGAGGAVRAGSPTRSSRSRAATRDSGATICCASTDSTRRSTAGVPKTRSCARASSMPASRGQTLLFGGIAVPPAPSAGRPRCASPPICAILERPARDRRVRCERGLDSHLPS